MTLPILPTSALALTEHLEVRARSAENLAELCFSLANDSYALQSFRQALVFAADGSLLAVSGLAKPEEDSPYLLWLKRVRPWLMAQLPASSENETPMQGYWFAPEADQLAAAPDGIATGWQEWWPAGVYVLPLVRRSGMPLGQLCLLLDAPPTEIVARIFAHIAPTWAYCWEMLAGKPRVGLKARWQKLSRKQRHLALAALAVFFLFPVRQTALAPAEIVPVDAVAMTAALDGVVKTVHVRPNQPVKAGDLLFSLDDTTLRNRLDVAKKAVAVADAELLAATQLAFDSSRSKSEIAALTGRAEERRAELAAVQAQLERVDAVAPYDGIVVFADAEEWKGRPVVTGERIMLLANPDKPGILIHLPVANAIALDIGVPIKVFLTTHPLTPITGQISETSYQATLSPDGVASYRLRARVDDDDRSDARMGLRGTAKLYGGWVALGYYILRRPLASLREWSGW